VKEYSDISGEEEFKKEMGESSDESYDEEDSDSDPDLIKKDK
jgi:hypothetical protein